jgi:hypothetical protein
MAWQGASVIASMDSFMTVRHHANITQTPRANLTQTSRANLTPSYEPPLHCSAYMYSIASLHHLPITWLWILRNALLAWLVVSTTNRY